MAQVPAAHTYAVGDGSTTQFSFEFPYLRRDDVFVEVDGVPQSFTWVAQNTVNITPAPATGAEVYMYRSTPAARPSYEFQLGAPFLPRYIDENFTQGLYVLQEGLGDIGRTMDRMTAVESQMTDVEHQVENFQIESGFEYLGDYGAGIVLSRYNQVVAKDGEWYRVAANTGLPITLTGDWVGDASYLRGVGDATVRYDLAQSTGATKVGTASGATVQITLDSLQDELGQLAAPATGPDMLPWVATPTGAVNTVVTVGTTGEFPSIGAALTYLSEHRFPSYISRGDTAPPAAEIRLLSGFVMQEQVLVRDVDLQWITITADDPEVVIQRASLVESRASRYPAFSADGGSLPRISVLFRMDDTGDAQQRCGYQLLNAATGHLYPGAGITQVSGRAIHLVGSTLLATDTIWDGAQDIGIRIANKSQAWMRRASFRNCRRGIALEDCSTLYFDGGVVSGAEANAVTCGGGSVLWARGADLTGAGGVALAVENGGTAVCVDADVSDCGNAVGPAVRVLTGGNLVLTGGAVDRAAGVGVLVRAARADLTAASVRDSGVGGIRVESGGVVTAEDADLAGASTGLTVISGGWAVAEGVSGSISQTPNILTPQGYIQTGDIVAARGQVTILEGANSITVPHGLTVQPLNGEITVVLSSNPGANITYWVGDITADTFTIGVTPTLTTATSFAWRAVKEV